MDTIFALSSGAPPAGIGIVRLTGPQVPDALAAVCGRVPEPRRAVRAAFRDSAGEQIDDGIVLYFPAPHSVTGEDVGELHCHGGRAVVAALEEALAQIPGCRRAEPGEFTRRAFANGRIDLAEAEGLGDLLSAETEIQRRAAMAMTGGVFSGAVAQWRERLLALSAEVEASLDFAEEDEVETLGDTFAAELTTFVADLGKALAAPHAEMLKEGFRVALAGPPNAGKSTLFNALVESEAAITAEIAGTTRDVLVQAVAIEGIAFSFVDMAGLRSATDDRIEAIGIERAEAEIAKADVVLWLGPEGKGPEDSWDIEAQCDRAEHAAKSAPDFVLSARSGEGMEHLRRALVERARASMPAPGQAALNRRQRTLIASARDALVDAATHRDPLLVGECLRRARLSFDALLGKTSTEDVLDAVFGRFCLGK
ncbi:tRNA uridine-5-carboxymethylaminomethyl(34) synthesis GTPase MnmE [Aurantiacibacter xanthus]|uniref:tRNA modification GTPase MnmE n=2 Tax=Aurantiacibacter xanthus TaxID=1784712 RepID=A0A3A1PGW7_9SPHN|nr:tRNA uridine-5-carboxymethylaminomethyl(34) synthesis GTPase MnmE [Aurantiacibacter xanthus]RIV92308.1 tRNA uridine-5-carboxymethylaminomethyl(34) synthesis GTPase MnmE [Aurantiacibacter xanthus]